MKMRSGLAGSVPMPVGREASRRELPFAPTPAFVPPKPRSGHALGVSSVALAAGTVLGGCASIDDAVTAWRVQPVYQAGQPGDQAAVSRGYQALARQYEGETRWSQAAEAWRKATLAEPDNAELHTSLGVALSQSQRVLQAIEAFRAAAALRPDNARTLNNLGFALSLDGRDEEAQRTLHRALASDPRHAQARANLAAVESRLGLRGAEDLLDGAPPQAVAALKAQAATPSVDPARAVPPAGAPSKAPAVASVDVELPLAPLVVVQTRPDAPALVIVAPDPTALQPVEATPATATTSSWSAPSRPLAELPAPTAAQALQAEPAARVAIVNAVGVRGAAAQVRELLKPQGVANARLSNQRGYREPVTVVQYRAGFEDLARRVASALPQGVRFVESGTLGSFTDVRVTLGHDRKAVFAACVARKSCAPQASVVVARAGH